MGRAVATAIALSPWDEHNQTLVGNVHPRDWIEPDAGRPLQPRGHRGGHGRAGHRRRRRRPRGPRGAGRARPDGRRLPERRLRAVEGAAPRRPRLGRCARRGGVRRAPSRRARAWTSPPSWRACGGCAPRISPTDSARALPRASASTCSSAPAASPAPTPSRWPGTPLRFRKAVIATGARAAAPPIPGLGEAGYLTNETVFSLTELPPRLAVIGAGPIGCELAQAFARFGAEVVAGRGRGADPAARGPRRRGARGEGARARRGPDRARRHRPRRSPARRRQGPGLAGGGSRRRAVASTRSWSASGAPRTSRASTSSAPGVEYDRARGSASTIGCGRRTRASSPPATSAPPTSSPTTRTPRRASSSRTPSSSAGPGRAP